MSHAILRRAPHLHCLGRAEISLSTAGHGSLFCASSPAQRGAAPLPSRRQIIPGKGTNFVLLNAASILIRGSKAELRCAVPLRSRLQPPFNGLGVVFGNVTTVGIFDADLILRSGVSLSGSLVQVVEPIGEKQG